MLGFLPRRMPDELFYSVLGRYRLLTGAATSALIVQAAFGNRAHAMSVILPGRLQALAEGLPGNTTGDDLAAQGTVLPYFSRIVSPDRWERLRKGVLEGSRTSGYNCLSSYLSHVTTHRTLNFCPECVRTDAAREGMAAWRRTHQLPGVFYCPEHGMALRTTGVPAGSIMKLAACPVEPWAGTVVEPLLPFRASMSVARNSAWLLNNPGSPIEPAALRAGSRQLLRDAGWIADTRVIRAGLRPAVASELGAENLEDLGCRLGLTNSRCDWPNWLWGNHGKIRAHPFRYLLLLAFLERPVADLLRFAGQEPTEVSPKILKLRRTGVNRWGASRRPAIIEAQRAAIVATRSAHPEASRSDLWEIAGQAMGYLGFHDPEWLDANLPSGRRVGHPKDWLAVDRQLLRLVQAAIARLRKRGGRPVRITTNRIALESGKQAVLQLNRERLPMCTAALESAAEDVIAFGKRCLEWAAAELVARGKPCTWSTFATLGDLYHCPWREELTPYARDLYCRIVVVATGEPPSGPSGEQK